MDEKELPKQTYEMMKTGILRKYRWPVFTFIILLLLMMVTAGYFFHKHGQSEEARLQQAKVMSEQYARDVNALENELKMSRQNAEMLAVFAARAQAGQVQPMTHFTVQAPTLPQAAQQVSERINSNDPTLPPVALEKTDRTVVTPNEEQQKVDVYKVNLDKPRGIGMYVSTASIGAIVQNNNIVVFGGPKYKNGGYEVGAAYMKRF